VGSKLLCKEKQKKGESVSQGELRKVSDGEEIVKGGEVCRKKVGHYEG